MALSDSWLTYIGKELSNKTDKSKVSTGSFFVGRICFGLKSDKNICYSYLDKKVLTFYDEFLA